MPAHSPLTWLRIVCGAALCVGLMIFFVRAAEEHARRVNTFKARGDQSGYLWDAENVYHNMHGRQPKVMIGERNRMPLYAGYLSLAYKPSMSDPEFFEVGKRANIYLALGMIVLIGAVLWRNLPPLAAANVTGIAAFGWFIYKAGYTQSELLYYTLFFLTFVCCWHLLRIRMSARAVSLGALAGGLAALTYLTKAADSPFIGLFVVVFGVRALLDALRPDRRTGTADRGRLVMAAATLLAFALVFLAVLSPYLTTNHRAFGRWFYNVNSTFYVWYDDWAHASVGTILHGDGLRWPAMAAEELPGPGRYWHEHTIGQMLARVGSGMNDMAVVSYRTYDYLPYVLLYGAVVVGVALTRWQVFSQLAADHRWLTLFLAAYFAMHVLLIAFYFPISGTGTARFLIAHLLPFFFVVSHLLTRSRLRTLEWSAGNLRLTTGHFQLVVLVILAADVAFRTWPRLMTTYGGF